MSEDYLSKAYQCFLKKEYENALFHINEIDKNSNNKQVKHNKIVVDFAKKDFKGITKFKDSICQILSAKFPDVDTIDISNATIAYNYAVLLYHLRYYYQCLSLCEKLLNAIKTLKNPKLVHNIVLLALEASLCCRSYKKTLDIAKNYGDILKSNLVHDFYSRLTTRAKLMIGDMSKINMDQDSIENIMIMAQKYYLEGDYMEAANVLGKYKIIQHEYNIKNQGEDVWATLNNNLGVIYLSIRKPYLATTYFQHALKEHYKSLENGNGERLIASRDKPLYVYNLGLALLAGNKPESAFECLIEAARYYPNNPKLWLRIAECCVKKCCSTNTVYTVRKIGSGPHTRVLVASDEKEKYPLTGESFAIPSLSLEFAALCLRNSMTLLIDEDMPEDVTTFVVQAPPGPPLNWNKICLLKNSILVLKAFIQLKLEDPLSALDSATQLLKEPDVTNDQKAWAHVYAAESLITLDRVTEAIEHLNPQMIHDLVSDLSPQMKDLVGVSVWAKAAVCHILRGDLVTARKILLQINSPKVLPLQMYLESCMGNIDNCQTLMRKLKLSSSP